MAEVPHTDSVRRAAEHLMTTFRNEHPNLAIRVFGSMAVAMSCPDHFAMTGELGRRAVGDIDLVTLGHSRKSLIKAAMKHAGFAETQDSAISSTLFQRLRFGSDIHGCKVEVFLDPLVFTHTVHIAREITGGIDILAFPYLVLLKLIFNRQRPADRPAMPIPYRDSGISQKRELRLDRKSYDQLVDLLVLFARHAAASPNEPILTPEILALTRRSWGLHRTITNNLDRLELFSTEKLADRPLVRESVLRGISQLREEMNRGSKAIGWHVFGALHRCFNIPFENLVEDGG